MLYDVRGSNRAEADADEYEETRRMAYKGEDLDLRTPQTWSTAGAEQGPSTAEAPARARRSVSLSPRNGPIWVDDVVLSCCNYAYDMAVAHRSNEVRLEHLLHALTRVEQATEVLEAHAVRVVPLRRETATIIVGELPVATTNGAPVSPRRSTELAEALRLAASHAYRRNAPAGVSDLLHVFFEVKPDLPGLAVLIRHSSAAGVEQPEPPLGRPAAYASEPRFAPPPAERIRSPRPTYRPPEPPRFAPSDGFQNARLDVLEAAVRNLSHELAEDRAGFSSLLKELQRDIGDQGDEASRQSGGLYDRLQQIETLLTSGSTGTGHIERAFERLQTIENALHQRLDEVSRFTAHFTQRLEGLERTMVERTPPQVDFAPLHARIERLEQSIRDGASETGRHWLGLTDRMNALDAVIADPIKQIDLAPISHRLDIIEEAVLSREDQPLNEVTVRLDAIERSFSTARQDAFAAQSSLGAEIKALAGAVATQSNAAERFQSSLTARVDGLAADLALGRDELAHALTAPVKERLQNVTSLLESRHSELSQGQVTLAGSLKELKESIEQQLSLAGQNTDNQLRNIEQGLVSHVKVLEQGLATHIQKSGEHQATYARDLADLHDALVKLNANQHTLAGAIDQWRTEASGDLSIISNRISAAEREVQKPMQMLSSVNANIEALHRHSVARAARRSRFWYWLFGTDDWLGESWPDQTQRIEAARLAAKARKA